MPTCTHVLQMLGSIVPAQQVCLKPTGLTLFLDVPTWFVHVQLDRTAKVADFDCFIPGMSVFMKRGKKTQNNQQN